MTRLTPRTLFFILGSILAIANTSRGDDTCNCPPDPSEQLIQTLTAECDSKVQELNDHLAGYEGHVRDHITALEEENDQKMQEHTAQSTEACESKAKELTDDIYWYNQFLDECRAKHAAYELEADEKLADVEDKLYQCDEGRSVGTEEQLALKSEVSDLRTARALQTEQHSKLQTEIERLTKSLKMEQDRTNDEKEKVNRVEEELRVMHQNAEATFIKTLEQLPLVILAEAKAKEMYGMVSDRIEQLYSKVTKR